MLALLALTAAMPRPLPRPLALSTETRRLAVPLLRAHLSGAWPATMGAAGSVAVHLSLMHRELG
jgi:hypothetical protein